jgi:hypothetical protein
MYVRIYDGMYARTVGKTHTCMYVFTMVCMYVCRYNAHMYVSVYDGMYVRTGGIMHKCMYVFTMVCMYVQ